MQTQRTSVLAGLAIGIVVAATAGCAERKSHTFLGTSLAPSLSRSTTATPTPTTTGEQFPTTTTSTPTIPPELAGAPEARFLYLANPAAGTVSQLAFDSTKGTFAPVGEPVLTGGSFPWALAADPKGRFLYCANRGSDDISCFAIDPESGALKAVPAGAPRSDRSAATVTACAGAGPSALAVSPDGTRLVVLNRFDGTAGSYRVNSESGMLTPANVMIFNHNQTGSDLAFAPEGNSFFVCGGPRGFVGRATIDSTGLMKQAGGVLGVGRSPVGLAVSPKGDRVVVATHPDNLVWTLEVDAKGRLKHKDKVKVGGDPSAVAFGATGASVYVAAKNAGKLFAYAYDAKGKLGADGSPVSTGAKPTGLAVDSGGGFVYTANLGDATVSLFGLDPVTRSPGVGSAVKVPGSGAEAAPGPGPRAIVAVK